MSSDPNIYAYRGRHLLSKYHARHTYIPNRKLSALKPILRNPAPTDDLPICIIGAGTAGLYTAMIFESLGISYQIVDADKKERVGGRLFTYHFPNGGPYDYYVSRIRMDRYRGLTFVQDVGAMRFPDTPFMARTFDLARNRNLPVKLTIPYIMQTSADIMFFNNVGVSNPDSVTGDPFNVESYIQDPTLTTPSEVSHKVATVIQPFRDYFRPDSSGIRPSIASGMQKLFDATDTFSMRSYMFNQGITPQDVSWCETLDDSTGAYDRALTESKYLSTLNEFLIMTWVYRSRYRHLGLRLAHCTSPRA